MSEPTPAVLLLWKKGEIVRCMVFDDHTDACDTADGFKRLGYVHSMLDFEHYPAGEKPADTPPRQKALFGNEA